MVEKTVGVEALTHRQKEILRLVSQHLQAKEVARALNISERTVKTHTEEARKRLGVATSRDAARLLVAHEAGLDAFPAIGLEDRWPSRPMDEAVEIQPLSAHEHTLLTQRVALISAMERSRDRLADAGSTRQAGPDRGDAESRPDAESERRVGEGSVHHDRGDSVADRRWPALERRLASLSVFQWLVLIVVMGGLAALLVSGLITSSLGALEAIEALHRQAG